MLTEKDECYKMMKQMGVSPEEFVNAPKKCVNEESKRQLDKKDLNKALAGKSGVDAMLEIGRDNNTVISMGQNMAYGRVIEAMGKLEKDQIKEK